MSNNPYDSRPWLALYDRNQPAEIAPDYHDALAIFQAAAARAPNRPAILYFDGGLTYRALDQASDSLAAALQQRGFAPGDRLGLYLQNVPGFVLGMLAAWKTGGIAVPITPMNRERELSKLFNDCSPRVLICHHELSGIVAQVPNRPETVLVTSPLDYQSRNDPRLFAAGQTPRAAGAKELRDAIAANIGRSPSAAPIAPSDVAFLVYTSGTTGVPKGAMCTHANVAFNAQTYRDWIGLGEGAPILGIAPLFHVTGLIGHISAAFITAAPLILTYRFEAGVMLDAAAEHRPAFTIGAITAFIALMNHPDSRREQLASLRQVYSGGAAIPPSVVDAFRDKFGLVIRNAYGLTETNSPTHLAPREREAPVDPSSGSLSVGLPVYNVRAWISDDDGRPTPVGEAGEIVVDGPMVVPGYWNKPQETAEVMREGGFHTGDIGFMDQEGWFYLIDRKKDMINASGYKVWPREIEDLVYMHPAVREAAVVGVGDPYRGETVKLVISLKPGVELTEGEMIAFCKPRLAAYKCPRIVQIMDELPKTPSGKILRRELRG